ncbi:hypothetical protein PInf_015540 [Phytophthora infestans]|nr:hypothetical protein PInf_015540 [Phytophthora infestans]
MRRATRVLVRLRSDHSSTKNCKNTLDEARNTLVITPEYAARLEANMKQLEECLKLSICTPLEVLDPRLDELLRVSGVCWHQARSVICAVEFQLKILSLTTCQIQELDGLDGCFRLKQINAHNYCIRSLEDSPQLLRYDCKADEASTEKVL